MSSPMSPVLPPKREVAIALLERASVFIHLDPRGDAVRVPPWLKSQPQLVLQVGLNMAVKIPDLEVGEDAMSCTLSFSRRPHFCWVPYSAIYALVGEDGRGMIWPDDIPPEVTSQTNQPPKLRPVEGRARPEGGRSKPLRSSSAPAPQLVVLEGAKTPTSSPPQATPVQSQRPHLRLVK